MVDAYRRRAKESIWKMIVNQRSSRRAYEESVYYGGLGLPAKKPEGQQITYDGPTKRWTHTTYGLGTTITEEQIEDNLYDDVPTDMADQTAEIGDSFAELWEILVHDIINNGTNTNNHTAGDTLAVFSNTHTSLRGGTWSNLLTPASDLSATSLQTAIQNFENTKDDSGKYQVIRPKYILVAPAQEWKVRELLESQYDPESANNSVNTITSRGLKPIVSPYLTDTDAFTLFATPPSRKCGIIAFMRRPVKFQTDGDFDTGDVKFKGTARFSVEVNKPNNLYHSAGA
jgi:hypothetical protein